MHCDILDSFYLKPNGEVPCEDDIGECITLGRVEDQGIWSPDAFFSQGKYLELRAAARAGRLPWGETCRQCAQLQPRRFHSGVLRRHIRKLQLEPSMWCALRCPACCNLEQLRQRGGDRVMPLELLDRVLAGFRRERYRIDYVEYAGQGEPLLHPQFAALAALVRRHYPRTLQRVITSGNVDFARTLGDEFVEQIVVSCDGARQESYEKYRVRGEIDRVFRFMQDAIRYSPRTRVIWKYILFEYDDSEEEILLAQRRAREMGVHEMRFVVTGTRFRSRRFHHGNTHLLPQLQPGISVRLNPLVSRMEQMADHSRHSLWRRLLGAGPRPWRGWVKRRAVGGFGRIFTTRSGAERYFVVEAWVSILWREPLGIVECWLDGERVARVVVQPCPQRFDRILAPAGVRFYRLRFSAPQSRPFAAALAVEVRELWRESSRLLLAGTFPVATITANHAGAES